jgi:hypothetical protein
MRKSTLKNWLGREQMREILAQQSFVCHENKSKQCAGHMLMNGDDNQFVQLAERLGIELTLSGKELVFDNHIDCIEHHAN